MSLLATASTALSLGDSRRFCADLTRRQARNFYFGLKLLPEPARSDMFALYAYMRLVDDIADDQGRLDVATRVEALDAWWESTQAALAGQAPADGQALWPAFSDMVHRKGVPSSIFRDVIAGQRQDLQGVKFVTFEDLREYCYRVAGVVGLGSIFIWGFEGGRETEQLAVDRGIAFQLTNILRDLREDSGRGRVYIPSEELAAAGVNETDLAGGGGAAFLSLMSRQIERARDYYAKSASLEDRITANCRPTLAAMTQIYRGLLEKIAADPARVLRQRVSLSKLTKLRIAWRAARTGS